MTAPAPLPTVTTAATPTASCCTPAAQQTCCAPEDKASCCGPDQTAGGGCGCA